MPSHDDHNAGIAILGAGPAGLTAAYVLARAGHAGTVFEADGSVGGIAKTVEFDGYRFDLGGHRFFTKLKPVERLWQDAARRRAPRRGRASRASTTSGQFFAYPLQREGRRQPPRLRRGGPLRALLPVEPPAAPRRTPETFEDWVTSRFGQRLYDIFFRSYTEKVWGIPGSEIRAEWAAQRIKDFSLCEGDR